MESTSVLSSGTAGAATTVPTFTEKQHLQASEPAATAEVSFQERVRKFVFWSKSKTNKT